MRTLGRWSAIDEHGFVLDILLQRRRDTEAAKTLLPRLSGEYDVPEAIQADQLRSYGAAIREIPSLVDVDHQRVISEARCSNVIERRASVATLRCRAGKIKRDRGGAIPDDLYLRRVHFAQEVSKDSNGENAPKNS